VQSAFRVAVSQWGIAPSEFWRMSIEEWWWLFDCKYVENQIAAKGFYINKEAREDLRARHKAKMEARK